MNLKKWPYWVRGGIIAILIGIAWYFFNRLLFINSGVILVLSATPFISVIASVATILFQWPMIGWAVLRTGDYFPIGKDTETILMISLNICWLFILGALVGWLYGKIKGRSSPKLAANSSKL